MKQKPQPHYDFEIAKICKWLKENGYIAHVSLQGNLRLEKKYPRQITLEQVRT